MKKGKPARGVAPVDGTSMRRRGKAAAETVGPRLLSQSWRRYLGAIGMGASPSFVPRASFRHAVTGFPSGKKSGVRTSQLMLRAWAPMTGDAHSERGLRYARTRHIASWTSWLKASRAASLRGAKLSGMCLR